MFIAAKWYQRTSLAVLAWLALVGTYTKKLHTSIQFAAGFLEQEQQLQWCLKYKSLNNQLLQFSGASPHAHPTYTAQSFSKLMRERGNPGNNFLTLKNWGSIKGFSRVVSLLSECNNQWVMNILNIYGLYVWDEHARLAEVTLKVRSSENSITEPYQRIILQWLQELLQ